MQARAIPNSDHSGNGTGGGGGTNSSLGDPGNPASPNPTDNEAQIDKAPAIQFMLFDHAWSATVVDGPSYSIGKGHMRSK